jgi:hypothetical protein
VLTRLLHRLHARCRPQVTFFRDASKPPTVASLARARSAASMQDASAAIAARPVHTRDAGANVGRSGFGIRRPHSPPAVLPTAPNGERSVTAAAGTLNAVPEVAVATESAATTLSGLGVIALRKQLADMRALEASRAEVCTVFVPLLIFFGCSCVISFNPQAYRADRARMREQYERKSANDNVCIAQLEKMTADLQDKLAALTRGMRTTRPPSSPPPPSALSHTLTLARAMTPHCVFGAILRCHHVQITSFSAILLVSVRGLPPRLSQRAKLCSCQPRTR